MDSLRRFFRWVASWFTRRPPPPPPVAAITDPILVVNGKPLAVNEASLVVKPESVA